MYIYIFTHLFMMYILVVVYLGGGMYIWVVKLQIFLETNPTDGIVDGSRNHAPPGMYIKPYR